MSRTYVYLTCSVLLAACGRTSEGDSLPSALGGSFADTGGTSGAAGGTPGSGGDFQSTGGARETGGSGAVNGVGGDEAMAGAAGAPAAGGAGAAPSGGSDSGGSGSGGTSSGGSGSDDLANTNCNNAYEGLPSGPREDGFENPSLACSELSDEYILELYGDVTRKTLQEYYYDVANSVRWGDSCSDSMADTEEWASTQPTFEATLSGSLTSDYFYEAAYCGTDFNTTRWRYRQLRCDYFDGERFSGALPPSGDAAGFLGSLLWFIENRNVHGFQMVSTTNSSGDAVESAELCTIETVGGDFGLCDTITLKSHRVSLFVDGSVETTEPETVRVLEGRCN